MARGTAEIPWIGMVRVRMSPRKGDTHKAELFKAFCLQRMDEGAPSALSWVSRNDLE